MYLYSVSGYLQATPSFETIYIEQGYKSVEAAQGECESHFGREVELPFQQPPIAFTHRFGRCNYSSDQIHINDHFEIEYLNQHHAENHYMLRIYPIEHKIKRIPHESNVIHRYMLKDGSTAVYGTIGHPVIFNLLVFEKDNWQYILSIDKRVQDNVTAEKLVEIANSFLTNEKVS
jgi:hypothetical protein